MRTCSLPTSTLIVSPSEMPMHFAVISCLSMGGTESDSGGTSIDIGIVFVDGAGIPSSEVDGSHPMNASTTNVHAGSY